ncbi:putative ABC transporter ATP-binding protein [Oxobacter pfennigii]|uniref:Putative ABC transporter ATP-binding protein n=1 Tax=Oxobacter pfennigii TaxID=36849 RepID=A0A0P8WK11_9CLOT|nr:ABC transporter ATP-binding protein [Oxobacter pfennigii]KPU42540.1 putative ABC transporter ATP-binding protein [Oxobacter pfennigii]
MSISVENLSFAFDKKQVLKSITFSAKHNELLSVLGPNGVGKSTMFRCITNLLNNYEGCITIEGKDIRHLGIKEMAAIVAYIPQSNHPSFNFSVFDMVLMGTASQFSVISTPGRRQHELAEASLERLGILHLKNRGFAHISGGERQLALIARALVQQAKILIMDEPTSNLDYGNQLRVLDQVKALAAKGYTIIQSTHNPDQTLMFSDKVLALLNGEVLAFGNPDEIINEELIYELYGVNVEIKHVVPENIRFCVPKKISGQFSAIG